MMRMALLFALPEEYAAFKRSAGSWQLTHRTPFKSFLHSAPSRQLVLVETGMGRVGMLEALDWLLGWIRPDLVIPPALPEASARNCRWGMFAWARPLHGLIEGSNTPLCLDAAARKPEAQIAGNLPPGNQC